MSEAKQQPRWTWEAYLDWEARQPMRYELVDGQVYAMAERSAEHDTIGDNLRVVLHTQLRGKRCRPHGPDLKVSWQGWPLPGRAGRLRPARAWGAASSRAGAVFEVLSKSKGWIDPSLKLRDYDATPSIRTYILISQDEQRAMVYARDADGRFGFPSAVLLEGVDVSIEIPELCPALPFSALYEGLEPIADPVVVP
jgi:Uma2 family endonuclease